MVRESAVGEGISRSQNSLPRCSRATGFAARPFAKGGGASRSASNRAPAPVAARRRTERPSVSATAISGWPVRSAAASTPAKARATKIKLNDKDMDHRHRIVFSDVVIKPFGKQSALPAIHALYKTLHQTPPTKARDNHSMVYILTQPGLRAVLRPP